MTRRLTIAVDGPGSSGKGTLSRAIARALGYRYVDTGAMYRAVAVLSQRQGIGWDDEARLAALAVAAGFGFSWDGDQLRISVDGEDLTEPVRRDDIGSGASHLSRHPKVRAALLDRQRALGDEGGVVMDGRDIGTVVLPNADLKIFLVASLDERARRRHAELWDRGQTPGFADVREALDARDRQDTERPVAPLRPAADAVFVDSTDLPVEDVVEQVLALVRQRLTTPPST